MPTQRCYLTGCVAAGAGGKGGSGTTSGGFPWGGASGNEGRGGSGGAGGIGGGGTGGTGATGGGGTGGTGGAPAPSPTCVNGDVQYVTQGELQTHPCPNHDCWIDASTGSAACYNGGAGVTPFRTCNTAADCLSTKYCATVGATAEIVLGAPVCSDHVCDWTMEVEQPCTGGQRCATNACATVGAAGSTSGGFPWGQGGAGN